MDVTVTVGEVSVKLRDADYSSRQVLHLLRSVAGVALALPNGEPEVERPVFGFSASMELDPERNLEPDLSEWFEE